jgi:hypothetical protein
MMKSGSLWAASALAFALSPPTLAQGITSDTHVLQKLSDLVLLNVASLEGLGTPLCKLTDGRTLFSMVDVKTGSPLTVTKGQAFVLTDASFVVGPLFNSPFNSLTMFIHTIDSKGNDIALDMIVNSMPGDQFSNGHFIGGNGYMTGGAAVFAGTTLCVEFTEAVEAVGPAKVAAHGYFTKVE